MEIPSVENAAQVCALTISKVVENHIDCDESMKKYRFCNFIREFLLFAATNSEILHKNL